MNCVGDFLVDNAYYISWLLFIFELLGDLDFILFYLILSYFLVGAILE